MSKPQPIRPRCRAFAVGLGVWLAAMWTWLPAGAQSAADGKDPYLVKAAFLCNFLKFTSWKTGPAPDAPLVIGILGQDPFGEKLDRTAQIVVVQNRKVQIQRLTSIQEAKNCQLVFVGEGDAQQSSGFWSILRKSGCLTVGESRGFAAAGGMIGFIEKEDRIRFEINVAAADAAGVTLQSSLLKLADVVYKKTPPILE